MKMNFSIISERLADTFGDREALVHIERGRRYSYREFHLLTNRIVNMMQGKLELRRGDVWLNILNNDNASLLHFYTAMKGEATACYANYRDSLADHQQQVDTVDAKVVFMESDLLTSHYPMLRSRGIEVVVMDPPAEEYPEALYFWDLLQGVSDVNPNSVIDDREDTLIMRFTGGTTGQGKCAKYSADNWLMCGTSYHTLPDPAWSPDTRCLHLAPITHGSGMLVLPTLFKGGCTVTMNTPDLEAWCKNIAAENITMAMMVPTLLYRLLTIADAARQQLASLRTVYYGAAPMSAGKLKALQTAFGRLFVQVYGATEHVGVALSLSKSDHQVESDAANDRLGSAGKPVAGVELQLMDDQGQPVTPGETGELWLRSRAICLGYFQNEAQTASEFEDGYWKSGDLGRMDEQGFVYIVDRKKDMIISGGFNVYANEVESALNNHPAVLMSAVVGVPHDEWGEAIHAEVVLKHDHTATSAELCAYVGESLGRYKTPKTLELVDELPISAVGKVLRRKVRDKYWTTSKRKVG